MPPIAAMKHLDFLEESCIHRAPLLVAVK